ncbi:MAG: 3-dehydroquinate synthase family protein [Planctomycetota bacterium]|nr:3-dehydroquinate synthase family protein [Planctomycetota bacterium]
MNFPSSPIRIEWPDATCELHTGSLAQIVEGEHLLAVIPASTTSLVLLRDAAVPAALLAPIRSFMAGRVPLKEFEVAGGESCKTPQGWFSILEILAQSKLDRGGLVIVAGGGALGDAAGFAASVWHRGVPWIAIPTTLLAMVDAHVGGKTAIHHSGIKNRIGSFHLPRAVLADPTMLDSLPLQQRSQGWAELIKAAWIGAPDLLEELESQPRSIPEDLIPAHHQIAAAVAVKVGLVEEDPFEVGRREHLNLGHTLAHALEMNTTPQLLHGDAVSLGMVFAATLAEQLSIAVPGTATRISDLLQRVGLPVDWSDFPIEPIMSSLLDDKKVRAGRQRWVLPRKPGDIVVEEISDQVVEQVFRSSPPRATVNPVAPERSHDAR